MTVTPHRTAARVLNSVGDGEADLLPVDVSMNAARVQYLSYG